MQFYAWLAMKVSGRRTGKQTTASWASSFAERNPTGASTLLAPASARCRVCLGKATGDWLPRSLKASGGWGWREKRAMWHSSLYLASPLLFWCHFHWMGLERELRALLLELLEIIWQESGAHKWRGCKWAAWYSHGANSLSLNRNMNFKINPSPVSS